jgi:cobalt-zinc-cadmium efflux system membrane fusion protein
VIHRSRLVRAFVLLGGAALLQACGTNASTESGEGAPPPAIVEHEGDPNTFRVDHPEQFPLVAVSSHMAASTLTVTGVVATDVSRNVPVISLASGRVIDLRARLGDRVQRGQLLLRVQSADVAGALSDYRKARADDALARTQLERAAALFERGAVAKKDLEVAQDAADKARVDVENTSEHLRVLGVDPEHTSGTTGVLDVLAPAPGVITEQNVTSAAGVKTLDNSPNLFTISDLSRVWIMCDVYENDLPQVRVGDTAEIRLAAYPDHPMAGRVGDIGAVLDPALRTAKVRIEVPNPGLMRIGMFVTAVFRGQTEESRAVVPATAVLHLHDRDWVYTPVDKNAFRRLEVKGGAALPGNMQEVVSGVEPGQQVVSNALVFQNTAEQ